MASKRQRGVGGSVDVPNKIARRAVTPSPRAKRGQSREAERLKAQNAVLEMIARGAALPDVLNALARLIEDQCPTCASMMLLADESSSNVLRAVAFGPNMPEALAREMSVVPIEATGVVCGAAAFLRQQVMVADFAVDQRFATHCRAAVSHGFRSCISTTVISRNKGILGTFALYFKEPNEPQDPVRELIDAAISLAAVAIDHWRNEQKMLRANASLLLLIEHAPIAIVAFDENRLISGWNPAAERIFGFTSAEATGRLLADLIIPPTQRAEYERRWAELNARDTLQCVEVTRHRKDGSPVEVAYWASLVRSPDGKVTGAISFIAEITEQKKLKDQLLRSSRMESVGRLAGGVAHDFNNLLAVISGYSESMLRRTDAEHPLRNHIEEIYRAATRGAALTQQLLAFSRRQRIAPQRIDLSQCVNSVYEMLRRVISRDIEIEITTPSPVHVNADPGQVEQVLVNLAINARDAMPDGGKITLLTEEVVVSDITSGGPKPGRYGRLAVIDTGLGMNAETSARIFEPFFTTKNYPKDGGGTGLGLSIVYGIVQQAGGYIAVRSAPGEGTRFDLYLPCASA